MKSQMKILILTVAVLLAAVSAIASQTLQEFDGVKGRSYHADFYTEKSCDSCHAKAQPETFPSDFACLDCHDGDELVEATARPEDEKWQNPHNNLHYGKDVPCMECHGEHQESKPLCAGCHSFEYPNYKK